MNIKRSIFSTLAALVLAVASFNAHAEFLDFTIDEGSVPGAMDSLLVADKLNGGYTEVITINPDLSIDFIGFVNFTALFANEGEDAVGSQLNCIFDACYNMYAIFEGSGQFNPITNSFSIANSTFDLYIDPDQDTTRVFNGGGADGITLGNDADDYKIGLATNLSIGSGIAGVPGAFLAIWDDFTLTSPEGEDYFISPRPFHLVVEATGDFDQDTFAPGTFTLTGDVSAVFRPVPEPSTIALMGLVLLGLGAVARMRRSS